MKKLGVFAVAVFAIISLNGCSKNDPQPINEDELLTSITTTLKNGNQTITLEYKDLDGDGPYKPIFNVSGTLKAATNYTGTVTFLNETTNPVGNITEEILAEGVDHQLFLQAPSAIGTFAYADQDANGKPIGLQFTLTTGAVTTGNLTVILRHEPNKSGAGVATGDITNAGGATDASVTYPIVVE
ncbi:MAG: type 1 periplasmic binding fold superfamily protein [Flavobacterium sp.]|nr:type 1 periplasmic binding fold superfamily protein [Flavobacterium sp.]